MVIECRTLRLNPRGEYGSRWRTVRLTLMTRPVQPGPARLTGARETRKLWPVQRALYPGRVSFLFLRQNGAQ